MTQHLFNLDLLVVSYNPPHNSIIVFSRFSSIVTIIGGIVFLAFAFSALFIKPDAGF